MTTEKMIKDWVVKKSTVTNPYGKYWSSSVTLGGMDINGTGDTIEKAYLQLTGYILHNKYYLREFEKLIKRSS